MNKEKLILDNIGLIYMVLKKYNLYKYADEYFDVGMIGLVYGAKTFDASKGYKVSTYLTTCIANEIKKYLRFQNVKKRNNGIKDISIYTLVGKDEKYLLDVIPSNENIEENTIKKEQLEFMYKEIFKLSDRDKFIICSTHGLLGYKELTQIEIAKELGVSRRLVIRRVKKFVENVRRKYE